MEVSETWFEEGTFGSYQLFVPTRSTTYWTAKMTPKWFKSINQYMCNTVLFKENIRMDSFPSKNRIFVSFV